MDGSDVTTSCPVGSVSRRSTGYSTRVYCTNTSDLSPAPHRAHPAAADSAVRLGDGSAACSSAAADGVCVAARLASSTCAPDGAPAISSGASFLCVIVPRPPFPGCAGEVAHSGCGPPPRIHPPTGTHRATCRDHAPLGVAAVPNPARVVVHSADWPAFWHRRTRQERSRPSCY